MAEFVDTGNKTKSKSNKLLFSSSLSSSILTSYPFSLLSNTKNEEDLHNILNNITWEEEFELERKKARSKEKVNASVNNKCKSNITNFSSTSIPPAPLSSSSSPSSSVAPPSPLSYCVLDDENNSEERKYETISIANGSLKLQHCCMSSSSVHSVLSTCGYSVCADDCELGRDDTERGDIEKFNFEIDTLYSNKNNTANLTKSSENKAEIEKIVNKDNAFASLYKHMNLTNICNNTELKKSNIVVTNNNKTHNNFETDKEKVVSSYLNIVEENKKSTTNTSNKNTSNNICNDRIKNNNTNHNNNNIGNALSHECLSSVSFPPPGFSIRNSPAKSSVSTASTITSNLHFVDEMDTYKSCRVNDIYNTLINNKSIINSNIFNDDTIALLYDKRYINDEGSVNNQDSFNNNNAHDNTTNNQLYNELLSVIDSSGRIKLHTSSNHILEQDTFNSSIKNDEEEEYERKKFSNLEVKEKLLNVNNQENKEQSCTYRPKYDLETTYCLYTNNDTNNVTEEKHLSMYEAINKYCMSNMDEEKMHAFPYSLKYIEDTTKICTPTSLLFNKYEEDNIFNKKENLFFNHESYNYCNNLHDHNFNVNSTNNLYKSYEGIDEFNNNCNNENISSCNRNASNIVNDLVENLNVFNFNIEEDNLEQNAGNYTYKKYSDIIKNDTNNMNCNDNKCVRAITATDYSNNESSIKVIENKKWNTNNNEMDNDANEINNDNKNVCSKMITSLLSPKSPSSPFSPFSSLSKSALLMPISNNNTDNVLPIFKQNNNTFNLNINKSPSSRLKTWLNMSSECSILSQCNLNNAQTSIINNNLDNCTNKDDNYIYSDNNTKRCNNDTTNENDEAGYSNRLILSFLETENLKLREEMRLLKEHICKTAFQTRSEDVFLKGLENRNFFPLPSFSFEKNLLNGKNLEDENCKYFLSERNYSPITLPTIVPRNNINSKTKQKFIDGDEMSKIDKSTKNKDLFAPNKTNSFLKKTKYKNENYNKFSGCISPVRNKAFSTFTPPPPPPSTLKDDCITNENLKQFSNSFPCLPVSKLKPCALNSSHLSTFDNFNSAGRFECLNSPKIQKERRKRTAFTFVNAFLNNCNSINNTVNSSNEKNNSCEQPEINSKTVLENADTVEKKNENEVIIDSNNENELCDINDLDFESDAEKLYKQAEKAEFREEWSFAWTKGLLRFMKYVKIAEKIQLCRPNEVTEADSKESFNKCSIKVLKRLRNPYNPRRTQLEQKEHWPRFGIRVEITCGGYAQNMLAWSNCSREDFQLAMPVLERSINLFLDKVGGVEKVKNGHNPFFNACRNGFNKCPLMRERFKHVMQLSNFGINQQNESCEESVSDNCSNFKENNTQNLSFGKYNKKMNRPMLVSNWSKNKLSHNLCNKENLSNNYSSIHANDICKCSTDDTSSNDEN